MNQKVKSYLNEEYNSIKYYIENNFVRCIRAGIESIIMCILMLSWIEYIMKPYLADMNNYAINTPHYDPIVEFSIAGFVMLSFVFLMTFGWSYIHKYLRKAFGKHEGIELHYQRSQIQ